MPLRPTVFASALVCVIALAVAGCAGEPVAPVVSPPEDAEHTYQARIRRGAHGVVHIQAQDLGSVAFGQGWAQGEDHGCTIADQVLKLRGQRSLHLGPGVDGENIRSDVAYSALGLHEVAWQRWHELSDEASEVVVGFVAGFNAWLEQTGPDGVQGWCSGHDWLGPIEAVDLLAYHEDLALLNGARSLTEAIATGELADPAVLGAGPVIDGIGWPTDDGSLLSLTSTPWEGELRLWESHLEIPGEMDIYGSTLVGLPMVLVGFNEYLAWAQVSAMDHSAALGAVQRVAPADMQEVPIGVQVRGTDGSVGTQNYLTWASEHGPAIDMDEGLVVAGADPDAAPLVEHLVGIGTSLSVRSVERVREQLGPMAWMATVAVGANGQVWRDEGVDPEGPSGSLPEIDPDEIEGDVDIGDLQELALGNDSSVAAEELEDLLTACSQTPLVSVPAASDPEGEVLWQAQEVDLADACDVLSRWDGTYNLDRQGALLFHELLARTGGLEGLSGEQVLVGLGEAVLSVQAAGFEVDDLWREVQWTRRGREDIPIHGGGHGDGVFNQVGYEDRIHAADRTTASYGPAVEGGSIGQRGRLVNSGTSYLLAVRLAAGSVEAEAILSHGQSADPTSPFYADQMYRFSDRAWRPVAYTSAAVVEDTESQRIVQR